MVWSILIVQTWPYVGATLKTLNKWSQGNWDSSTGFCQMDQAGLKCCVLALGACWTTYHCQLVQVELYHVWWDFDLTHLYHYWHISWRWWCWWWWWWSRCWRQARGDVEDARADSQLPTGAACKVMIIIIVITVMLIMIMIRKIGKCHLLLTGGWGEKHFTISADFIFPEQLNTTRSNISALTIPSWTTSEILLLL